MRYFEPVTYIEALGIRHPTVDVHSHGDGSDYESMHWVSDTVVPKAVLDQDILELTRDRGWELIKAERERRQFAGVKVGPYWFNSDPNSRIQQLGLVIFGSNLPPGIMWKTLPNTFVQMTPALALQVFQATALYDQQVFGAAEIHRAAVYASTDPSSYNYLAGWPATYSGVIP